MKSYTRGDRVAGLVQEALSDVLKKSIQDPRLESAVITGVKMSPDLKLAKVYFTVSDRVSSREEAAEGFKKAGPFINIVLRSKSICDICRILNFTTMNPLTMDSISNRY
jgi:ribosome-binding factor A